MPLPPSGAHMHAPEGDIAAEDRFALALEAGSQCVRQRADPGDHHDAGEFGVDLGVQATTRFVPVHHWPERPPLHHQYPARIEPFDAAREGRALPQHHAEQTRRPDLTVTGDEVAAPGAGS